MADGPTSEGLFFFGSPPNWHYGGAFAYHLDQLGVECEVPHEEYCASAARRLQKGDCAVFCSYSGDLNRFPIGIAPIIKERGGAIVAITNSQSPLAELADCALAYPPLERYYEKIAGFYSCECTSYMLDALLATVFLACDPERKNKDAMLRDYRGLVTIPPYATTI